MRGCAAAAGGMVELIQLGGAWGGSPATTHRWDFPGNMRPRCETRTPLTSPGYDAWHESKNPTGQ